MKRPVVLAMMVISLYGCSQVQVRDVRATNASNLRKLQIGMSKGKVLEIMGTGTEKVKEEVYYQGFLAGYREVEVQNPYRTEIKKIGNRTYEVLYYYANVFGMRMGYWDASYRERKVTDNVLTPLVFEGNTLIGWGWEFVREQGLAEEDLTDRTNWMLWGR